MEITLLGLLLIPIGVIFLFLPSKYLFFSTLFFAPFAAASVLNIESITFGLQPSYYFGILFILKETLNFFFKNKFTFAKPNIFFLWFLFFSLISLIFPIIFENKIEVFWQDVGFYPLTLTVHNFTQLFYLIFIFLIYIYSKNFFQQSQNKQKLFKEIINIQIFSIIFVVFWGLLQIAGGYLSFNLPSLFSNRLGVGISNPPVHGFFRMNSVFPEPSMLAFYLASMLGLFLFIPSNFIKIGKPVLLFAIIIGGVLSISSSFLLGLGIICLLLGINFFIFLFKKKRVRKWILKKKTISQKNKLKIKKPLVGYVGVIYDWFDMNILEYCAEKKDDFNFVIIGPSSSKAIEEEMKEFTKKYKNIFWLGEKSYQDVPEYIQQFDVCIVPFKINELIKNVDPIKVYEYLAMGKPVVSTYWKELEKFSYFIALGLNYEDFLKKIEDEYNKNSEGKIKERRKFAEENSWQKRAEKMMEIINKKLNNNV